MLIPWWVREWLPLVALVVLVMGIWFVWAVVLWGYLGG